MTVEDIQAQFHKAIRILRGAADWTDDDETVVKLIANFTGLTLPARDTNTHPSND